MAEIEVSRKPRRKKRKTGLIVAIVLGGMVVLAIVMMQLRDSKKEGTAVEVTPVATRTIVQTVVATGMIDPETQVKISSEVSGEIIYLGVKEGDTVQKGQVLVRINRDAILAQREQAQAAVEGALARQESAKATLIRNQQELKRVEQLFEKNLSTAQDKENAETQVRIAVAEQGAAMHQVEQQQASLRQTDESLKKTTIVAPISGTVTKLNSKVGEKVVGAIQMTGTEIMTIADLSVIEAVVDVSETDVVEVSIGDTAEIEVDAIPQRKFMAVVSQIANSPKQSGAGTNEQLTNFEVRVRFIDPDERLRPGMTATATIQTAKENGVLSVPIQSVTTRTERNTLDSALKAAEENDNIRNLSLEKKKDDRPQPIVFLKHGDSAVARPVETGIRDDQYIQIKSGVSIGDTVVSGSYKAISKDLEDGAKIYVEDKTDALLSGKTSSTK